MALAVGLEAGVGGLLISFLSAPAVLGLSLNDGNLRTGFIRPQ